MEGKKDFMDFLEENKEEIFRCVRRGATWSKELESLSINFPNLDFQVRNWLVKNGIHDYVFSLSLIDNKLHAVLRKKEEHMDFLWYVVLFLAALFLSSVMYDLKTMSLLPSKENFLP